MLEQYAADVIGILNHLGIERVTYAGHSLDGGIGYLLALGYPERLARLVLMASIPANGIAEGDPAEREEQRAERRRGDRDALMSRHRASLFRDDVETAEWFEDRADHVLGVSDGHYDGGGDAMRALHVGDRLGEIEVPTLVITGSVDVLLTSNLRDFRRLPNAALQVFACAGHEVAVHEPDGVAHAIAGLIERGVATSKQLTKRVAAAQG
jgi:3-oxoadipate enol-lactonase